MMLRLLEDIMRIIKEKYGDPVAINLRGDSYNGGEDEEVSWKDLYEAQKGDDWYSSNNNCGRAAHQETLVIKSRDGHNIICNLTTRSSPDSPNAQTSEDSEDMMFVLLDKKEKEISEMERFLYQKHFIVESIMDLTLDALGWEKLGYISSILRMK
jgi:hypothetical protein